jgi:hypothetical protein
LEVILGSNISHVRLSYSHLLSASHLGRRSSLLGKYIVRKMGSAYHGSMGNTGTYLRCLWGTDALCARYAADAKTRSDFDGALASARTVEKLFSKEERAQFPAMNPYLYRPVGELMRRQCDGSLPALVQCFRTILRDYDPAALGQLQVKQRRAAHASRAVRAILGFQCSCLTN